MFSPPCSCPRVRVTDRRGTWRPPSPPEYSPSEKEELMRRCRRRDRLVVPRAVSIRHCRSCNGLIKASNESHRAADMAAASCAPVGARSPPPRGGVRGGPAALASPSYGPHGKRGPLGPANPRLEEMEAGIPLRLHPPHLGGEEVGIPFHLRPPHLRREETGIPLRPHPPTPWGGRDGNTLPPVPPAPWVGRDGNTLPSPPPSLGAPRSGVAVPA